MNVSGVRPYAGFYQYNSIKISQLHSQQMAVEEAGKEVISRPAPVVHQAGQPASVRKDGQGSFDSYDYAQQYQKRDNVELKGKDSDVSMLDTRREISNLAKDQMLQQYQFFVGSDRSSDASVTERAKQPAEQVMRFAENFVL